MSKAEQVVPPPTEGSAPTTALNRYRMDWAATEYDKEEEMENGKQEPEMWETLRVIRDALMDHPDAFAAVREAFAKKRREEDEREAEKNGGRICVRCRGICEAELGLESGRGPAGDLGIQ